MSGGAMKHVLPVLTVVAAIIALWYAAAVGLNRAWVYDQAERAGVAPASGMALIAETWSQERGWGFCWLSAFCTTVQWT